LYNISKLAAKQTKIVFFTTEERQKMVFPLPPTIYEMYNQNKNLNNMLNDQKYIIIKEVIRMDVSSESIIEKRLRFQCFFVLKSFINSPFMQVRDSTKTDRLTTRCRSFMDNLFPLIGNRETESLYYVECSSDILALMLSEKRNFLVRE